MGQRLRSRPSLCQPLKRFGPKQQADKKKTDHDKKEPFDQIKGKRNRCRRESLSFPQGIPHEHGKEQRRHRQIAQKAHTLNVIDVQRYDTAVSQFEAAVKEITAAVLQPRPMK